MRKEEESKPIPWEATDPKPPVIRSGHLENQILPGIAAYETLQSVMSKEEALQTVHGYVEQKAWRMKRLLLKLMRIPGLYRRVPGIFARETPKLFGETAGFAARELQTTGGVWRIDMIKCPYHDACVHYGCPELCPCFCDSDDITYGDLHPRMGYPESANDTPELIDYLRVLRDEGFFNAEEPYVLSMEVTLRPGEDEDIVLANTKRVLNRAWAMLED